MGAWGYMNRELPALLAGIVPLVLRQPAAVGQPGDGLGQAARARAGALVADAFGKGAGLMPLTLRVPALGESISEATLGAWKHAEGDEVAADEPLVEVESEKATLEVPSPGAGVLRKILRKSRRDRGRRRRDRRDRAGRREGTPARRPRAVGAAQPHQWRRRAVRARRPRRAASDGRKRPRARRR